MKLLFICGGNTCRSVIACACAGALSLPGVEIYSAGLEAEPGTRCPEEVRTILKTLGIDGETHIPSKPDRGSVMAADLILTMTERQRSALAAIYPEAAGRIRMLDGSDIPDPWGRGAEFYAGTFSLIKGAVSKLAGELESLRQETAKGEK